MNQAISPFLPGFPALFSIVNPISGALSFANSPPSARSSARGWPVTFYSLIVMTVALLAGPYVLGFLGITLEALRIAGSIMVTLTGWHLLQASEEPDDHKQAQVADAGNSDDIVLFPLAIPITTGPGAISVAITLGSAHPQGSERPVAYFLGMTAATMALAVVIWITYRSADRISRLMGRSGSRTVTRLSAFLLLCIDVQILITGAANVLAPLLRPQ